jgi:hypothetical protein
MMRARKKRRVRIIILLSYCGLSFILTFFLPWKAGSQPLLMRARVKIRSRKLAMYCTARLFLSSDLPFAKENKLPDIPNDYCEGEDGARMLAVLRLSI